MRYSIGNTSTLDQFKYIIGNKYYIFRAILFNADSAVTLTKTAIKELLLNDNIFNFYLDGYCIIDNTDDGIERYKSDDTDNNENKTTTSNSGFKVRGDGRDILHLTILPLLDGEDQLNAPNAKYNELYGLNYYFVLSNETNLPSDSGKLKKYDIVDLDYQILKERKTFFTTSDLVKNVNTAQSSDNLREAYTGDCIKAVLTKALEEDSLFATLPDGTTPNFEQGSYKVFFSSPSDMSAMDNIEYLLSMHTSSDSSNDFSLFKKNSFTGEFVLRSTADIFKYAYIKRGELDAGGAEFIENFNITGAQDSDKISINDIKKPNLTLEMGDMSDVLEVNFFNVPADIYTEKVKTKIVHAYNFKNKSFILNCVDGNIEEVKRDFTSNYVNTLKGKFQKPYPSFINNQLKKTNQTFDNVFTTYHDPLVLLSQGRNKALYGALVANMGVEIIVKGNLVRGGGKFFSIDRRGSYIDNDFDNKFLGIYYILDVKHTFKDNSFYDKITAVKTYHFTDPKINENTI